MNETEKTKVLKIQDTTQVKPHHLRFVFSAKIFYQKIT